MTNNIEVTLDENGQANLQITANYNNQASGTVNLTVEQATNYYSADTWGADPENTDTSTGGMIYFSAPKGTSSVSLTLPDSLFFKLEVPEGVSCDVIPVDDIFSSVGFHFTSDSGIDNTLTPYTSAWYDEYNPAELYDDIICTIPYGDNFDTTNTYYFAIYSNTFTEEAGIQYVYNLYSDSLTSPANAIVDVVPQFATDYTDSYAGRYMSTYGSNTYHLTTHTNMGNTNVMTINWMGEKYAQIGIGGITTNNVLEKLISYGAKMQYTNE